MLTKSNTRKTILVSLLIIALLTVFVGSASARGSKGFIRWPVFMVDGEDYYWAGAPDGPNGETDVPGHSWLQVSPEKFYVKHFNTGPFGASKWWSSDAPDGALLYKAVVIIDKWTPEMAEAYAARGYVHYHELISVEDGTPHPTKVGWFKHIARISFTLDGGPRPDLAHEVIPGVDYEFMPNWFEPYAP